MACPASTSKRKGGPFRRWPSTFATAESPAETQLIVPFFKDFALPLGLFFIVTTYFMVVGFSNAVNLTDGLDGLATGAMLVSAGAFTLIGVWQFNQSCATNAGPQCYEVRNPLDLAIVDRADINLSSHGRTCSGYVDGGFKIVTYTPEL